MKKFAFLFVAISLLSASSFVSADNNTLLLDVDVDEASFDAIIALGGGETFNVVGTFGDGGTFRCWGWIDGDGAGSVSQVFNIPGRGAIMTQGIEGGFLAITGGTGDFSNLRGDALQTFTGDGFNFTIEFEVKGAGF
jgi:hypothetical protein